METEVEEKGGGEEVWERGKERATRERGGKRGRESKREVGRKKVMQRNPEVEGETRAEREEKKSRGETGKGGGAMGGLSGRERRAARMEALGREAWRGAGGSGKRVGLPDSPP